MTVFALPLSYAPLMVEAAGIEPATEVSVIFTIA
jgi:hypothetical protein